MHNVVPFGGHSATLLTDEEYLDALAQCPLSWAEKFLVLKLLAKTGNGARAVITSRNALAKQLGMERGNLGNMLTRLEGYGILRRATYGVSEVTPQGTGQSIELITDVAAWNVVKETTPCGVKNTPCAVETTPGLQAVDPQQGENSGTEPATHAGGRAPDESLRDKEINNLKPTAASGEAAGSEKSRFRKTVNSKGDELKGLERERFDQLWETYGPIGGKARAVDEFQKLHKTMDAEQFQFILHAARVAAYLHREEQARRADFSPRHLVFWLKYREFEDDRYQIDLAYTEPQRQVIDAYNTHFKIGIEQDPDLLDTSLAKQIDAAYAYMVEKNAGRDFSVDGLAHFFRDARTAWERRTHGMHLAPPTLDRLLTRKAIDYVFDPKTFK